MIHKSIFPSELEGWGVILQERTNLLGKVAKANQWS